MIVCSCFGITTKDLEDNNDKAKKMGSGCGSCVSITEREYYHLLHFYYTLIKLNVTETKDSSISKWIERISHD